jgi:hypothetical protein
VDEGKWLACRKPDRMLNFLERACPDRGRKFRLACVACCRRVWDLLADPRSRDALATAERFVDGHASLAEMHGAYLAAHEAGQAILGPDRGKRTPYTRAAWAAIYASAVFPPDDGYGVLWAKQALLQLGSSRQNDGRLNEREKADCLREVFGNPFRPTAFDPAWRTPAVSAVSAAAYEERSLPTGALEAARLAVLADALEDAGCADPAILEHLREPGHHVRGCWALDLCLGRR